MRTTTLSLKTEISALKEDLAAVRSGIAEKNNIIESLHHSDRQSKEKLDNMFIDSKLDNLTADILKKKNHQSLSNSSGRVSGNRIIWTPRDKAKMFSAYKTQKKKSSNMKDKNFLKNYLARKKPHYLSKRSFVKWKKKLKIVLSQV